MGIIWTQTGLFGPGGGYLPSSNIVRLAWGIIGKVPDASTTIVCFVVFVAWMKPRPCYRIHKRASFVE